MSASLFHTPAGMHARMHLSDRPPFTQPTPFNHPPGLYTHGVKALFDFVEPEGVAFEVRAVFCGLWMRGQMDGWMDGCICACIPPCVHAWMDGGLKAQCVACSP